MSSTILSVMKVVCQPGFFYFPLELQQGSVGIPHMSHAGAVALRCVCVCIHICMYMCVCVSFYCRGAPDEGELPSFGHHSNTGGKQSIATRLCRLKLISQ